MMETLTMPSQALMKKLEELEISAWKDLYINARKETKEKCGMDFKFENGILYTSSAKLKLLSLNRVIGAGLNEDITEGFLRNAKEFFRKAAVPKFLLQICSNIYSDSLGEMLKSHGFSYYSNWVRLFLEPRNIPEIKTDLRIQKITRTQGDIFEKLAAEGFNWPEEIKYFVRDSVGKPHWQHFMAFDKDNPAATAALYIEEDSGWLGIASTLPAFRNRGAQSALISRRIKSAARRDLKLLSVETAEETPAYRAPSYQNIKKMGFNDAYKKMNFVFSL